jgi:NADP-dependent 3-hydroxy acid dehydrogenase YdfG
MGRILITGCSTGFGRAAAVELTERGHDVVATARRAESIEDLEVAARLVLDVDVDASVSHAVDAAGELEREWANARVALGALTAPGPEPVAFEAAMRGTLGLTW